MKCPLCGTRLKGIPPLGREEWLCPNEECKGNKKCSPCFAEYYGRTQEEINNNVRPSLNESQKTELEK